MHGVLPPSPPFTFFLGGGAGGGSLLPLGTMVILGTTAHRCGNAMRQAAAFCVLLTDRLFHARCSDSCEPYRQLRPHRIAGATNPPPFFVYFARVVESVE